MALVPYRPRQITRSVTRARSNALSRAIGIAGRWALRAGWNYLHNRPSGPSLWHSNKKRKLELPKPWVKGPGGSVVPVSAIPKQRKLNSMRGRYHTTGSTGKRFKKSSSTPKYNKFVKRGCITKLEDGGVLEGNESVYVGHYSLPVILTLKTAFRALARRILMDMNIHLHDPDEDSGMNEAHTIQIGYRDSIFGELKTANTAVVTAGSVVDYGLQLETAVISSSATTDKYYEIVYLNIFDAANKPLFRADGHNILFDIVGNSHMQIQNRTLANDNVGDEMARSVMDITNNPLRGKRYDGYGNMHPLRFNNITTAGVIPQFYHENQFGLLQIDPQTATNYTTEVRASLSKPPLASAFGNTNKHSYVMLKPGETRQSTCKGKIRCNLNTLLRLYSEHFWGKVDFGSPNDAQIKKGASCFYGFEKLCDVRDSGLESATLAVGYEINSTILATVAIKKATRMNAFNIISTS